MNMSNESLLRVEYIMLQTSIFLESYESLCADRTDYNYKKFYEEMVKTSEVLNKFLISFVDSADI